MPEPLLKELWDIAVQDLIFVRLYVCPCAIFHLTTLNGELVRNVHKDRDPEPVQDA